ncbi:MAG: response regulator, partial [Chloroflexi bacterium]|nr:response regulator [Chloroflexota bacterium]
MKVLIIEDDPEIVESISLAFHIRWPEAEVLSSRLGSRGIELVRNQPPDAVILDLGLPDMSGFEVLKQIRAFSSIPIIILTI